MKPRICILKTDGTNCDEETRYAFMKAGGDAQIISINQLRNKEYNLKDFQILTIPGGFSYGDDLASGTLFSLELLSYLKDNLLEFVAKDKPILGICNGFQVLIRTGLLPFNTLGNMQAALSDNASGKFECRWVTMKIEKSPCIFMRHMEEKQIILQVAHAEGNIIADDEIFDAMEKRNLVVLRYSFNGMATEQYPYNPNGSHNGIAGICDPTGKIFGLMPHPERFVDSTQYPNWRSECIEPYGLQIFKNALEYVG